MDADIPVPPDAAPARPRESIAAGLTSAAVRRFAAAQESRWMRVALLALPAVVTGALLAPMWTDRSYPTDAGAVGTPAAENIKAPLDIEVADTAATDRLRDQAESSVRRIFDLDTALPGKIAEQLAAAMSFARDEATTHEEIQAGFEKRLGVVIEPHELDVLRALGFAGDLEVALRRWVTRAMSRPVVAAGTALDTDLGRGISIQRVPDDGAGPRGAFRVEDIVDVETARADLRVRAAAEEAPGIQPVERDALVALAMRLVRPNLTLDRASTEKARERARAAVTPVLIAIKKGEMIVRDGERITERQLLILQALSKTGPRASAFLGALGAAVLVLALVLVGVGFVRAQPWGLAVRGTDLLFLSTLVAAASVGMRLWVIVSQALHEGFGGISLDMYILAMPVAAAALITRLVLRADIALLVGVLLGVIAGVLVPGPPVLSLYLIASSTLGVTLLRRLTARGGLVRAGLRLGVAQAGFAIGLQLLGASPRPMDYAVAAGAAFAGGLLAAFLTLALTPAVETLFGYTTDLKLLELANLNHPALKDLLVQAPGSYHHSVVVASLVEAAAEAIGANPLLTRVMAYYHDLGKGCNPGYFIENQRGSQNPHDKLKPQLSAMVIRRHVADGLEIARRYKLAEPILAAIEQHHGSTLIHYFYTRAKEQENEDGGGPVAESDYRYPGRKPQSREAALVMLGDSVEAAARSLPDPNPSRLQGLVNRIINVKFTDGQLEECDLTLRDLHTIAKSFSRVINSIYHQRVEYPDILGDLSGGAKKSNVDSDQKSTKGPENGGGAGASDRPDNLRRLGLS